MSPAGWPPSIDANMARRMSVGEASDDAPQPQRHVESGRSSRMMRTVDFINMQNADNQKTLLDSLSKLVSKDKIKTFVIGMTSLGLVEITREKKEKPLWEQI